MPPRTGLFQKQWLAGLALFVLGVAAYIPALNGKFIWDDLWLVVENSLMRDTTGLLHCWTHPKPDPIPFTLSALWLQWHLGGGSPLIFHIVSMLTQALAALLFWRVLLCLAIPAPWFCAALFAVHPVCAASAAFISEQKNTISIVFYLLALLLYLQYAQTGKRLRYGLAIVAFICALLSKGSTVVLPAVLVLIIWWQQRKPAGKSRPAPTLRPYLPTIPFFVLSLLDAFLVVSFQQTDSIGFAVVQTMDGLQHVLAAAKEIWIYAWHSLVPVRLALVYPRWQIDSNDLFAYVPFLGLCVAILVCWINRKTWGRAALVGLGAFIVSLSPVLGFVDMSFLLFSRVADHLQYLALLAFIPLIVCAAKVAVTKLSERFSIPHSIAAVVAAIVLACCFISTAQRSFAYTTDERLWSDTVKNNPQGWLALINLGHINLDRNNLDKAAEMYRRAAAAEPHYFEGEEGLGKVLERQGKTADAITHFRAAARIVSEQASPAQLKKRHVTLPQLSSNPDIYTAHAELAMVLVTLDRSRDALAHFRSLVSLRPQEYMAHVWLATDLAVLHRTDEAIAEFSNAIRLQPTDSMAHFNFATFLTEVGKLDDALLQYDQCTKLVPNDADLRVTYANALLKAGKRTDALVQLREACRINPQHLSAANLLVTVTHQ
jgi:tetratricopeptide (TPR) repeat protein